MNIQSEVNLIRLSNMIIPSTPKTTLDPMIGTGNEGTIMFNKKVHKVYIPNESIDDQYNKIISNKIGICFIDIIVGILGDNGLLTEHHLEARGSIVFLMLHEEGHYLDASKWCINSNRENFYACYEAQKTILSKQLYTDNPDTNSWEFQRKNAQLYRQNPFEARADNYAIKKILSCKELRMLFM